MTNVFDITQSESIDQTEVLTVIYRKFNKTIIAIFPRVPSSFISGECMMYTHIGQHGSGDFEHVFTNSEPCTKEEAEELDKELWARGYNLQTLEGTDEEILIALSKHECATCGMPLALDDDAEECLACAWKRGDHDQ